MTMQKSKISVLSMFSTLILTVAILNSTQAFTQTCKDIYQPKHHQFDPGSSDFYARLGVGHDADPATIKKAYRKAAMIFHPDRQGHDDKYFVNIKEAYDVLSDEVKRSYYDANIEIPAMSPKSRSHGYADPFTMDRWGNEDWNSLNQNSRLPLNLNVRGTEFDILVRWLNEGNSAIPAERRADKWTRNSEVGFNSIQFTSAKVKKTASLAVQVVREMGSRLQVDALIRYLEAPPSPEVAQEHHVGLFWYVKRQAIFELVRIYSSNRNLKAITRYFETYLLNVTEPRNVFLIVRGLESVNTPESSALLSKVVSSSIGWREGSGNTFLDWTEVIQARARKALDQRTEARSAEVLQSDPPLIK